MAKIRLRGTVYHLPYVKTHRGKRWQPRFEPSPALRRAGWTGFPFQDAGGQWLTDEKLIVEAQKILARIDAWQGGDDQSAPDGVDRPPAANSLDRLFHDYSTSTHCQTKLTPATRSNYMRALKAIGDLIPLDVPIGALDVPEASDLFDKMKHKHGLSTALHHCRVLKAVFAWGRKRGYMSQNPLLELRLEQAPARVRFGEEVEIQALINAADALGLFTMGSMIATAVVCGHRQGDISRFPIDLPEQISHNVRTSKRNRMALMPQAVLTMMRPRLTKQADHARAVTAAAHPSLTPAFLFIRESTGLPYPDRHAINKDYRRIRIEAAKAQPSVMGWAAWETPMTDPDSGADISGAERFTFADLRDTALTRLVLAGCTLGEVCSITSHTEGSAVRVWRNYLAYRPELAENAGGKIAKWWAAEGISY
jgi:hypothetical protein